MRGFLLIALLSSCSEGQTLGDVVNRWSEVTCSRYIRCGWTMDPMERCVEQSVSYLCGSWDCDRPFRSDRLDACLNEYEEAECSDSRPICTF